MQYVAFQKIKAQTHKEGTVSVFVYPFVLLLDNHTTPCELNTSQEFLALRQVKTLGLIFF